MGSAFAFRRGRETQGVEGTATCTIERVKNQDPGTLNWSCMAAHGRYLNLNRG